MRVAAIDLGTNTTRLLVADVVDGCLEPIVRREAITRLGESVDRRRTLLPTSIARVRNVLVDYRREAELLGAERVLAVGTSAVRDAENGEALLGEVERSYGFATRLLDGVEEAALMVRGVASGRALEPGTLIVDIGGGSTELVLAGDDGATCAISTEAGSVRLTERFLRSDPPSSAELDACSAHVRSLLPALDVARAIGVAGTVSTAAAIERAGEVTTSGVRLKSDTGEMRSRTAARSGTAGIRLTSDTDGYRLSRVSVNAIAERLARMPLAGRERVSGLEPARAPVIVAGMVVLREILDRYGLAELEVSERDLLEGAALAAAELPEPQEGTVPPSAFTCC